MAIKRVNIILLVTCLHLKTEPKQKIVGEIIVSYI